MRTNYLSTDNNIYDFQYLNSFEKGFGLILNNIYPSIESDFYLLSKLHKLFRFEGASSYTSSFKDLLNLYSSFVKDKMQISLKKIECNTDICKYIIREINEDKFCLVIIDLYDLYYSIHFKKNHVPYLLIINGVDEKTELLSIIDTQQTAFSKKIIGLEYENFVLTYNMIKNLNQSIIERYNFKYFYSLPTTETNEYSDFIFKNVLDTYLHKIESNRENDIISSLLDKIDIYTNDNHYNDVYLNDFEKEISILINDKYVFFEELEKRIICIQYEDYSIKDYASILLKELERIKKTVVYNIKKGKEFNIQNSIKHIADIERQIKFKLEILYSKIANLNHKKDLSKTLPIVDITQTESHEIENIVAFDNHLSPMSQTEIILRNIITKNLSIDDFPISATLNSLGVNSIMAIKIMHEILKEFNREIPLHLFLNNCKLSDILSFLNDTKNDTNTYTKLTKSEKREYYPLGRYQKDLIMSTSKLYGDGLAYNITIILDKKNGFSKKRLESAFNQMISKHEAFRMNFLSIHEDDYIIVHDKVDFKLENAIIDYNVREEFFTEWIKPFDLEESILIRACLLEYNNQQVSSLLVDIHHIILDGGSINIFFRELASFYNEENMCSSNKIDFTDYIIWESNLTQASLYTKQQKFWENYYFDGIPQLKLPVDNPQVPSNEIGYESTLVDYMYSENFNLDLANFNQKYGYTHYMTLLSVIDILLYKYTKQRDLVVWTPTANRQIAEQINMIGMFVNTVPIRNKIEPNNTFLEFLKSVKENCINVFSNTSFNIDELKKKLSIDKNAHIHQLVFIYQNYESNTLKFDKEIIMPFRINQNITRFDLLIEAYENRDRTKVVVKYKPQLFERKTIDKFINQLETLTLMLLNNPNIKINDIEIAL